MGSEPQTAEIVRADAAVPMVRDTTPAALLALAVSKDLDIEKLKGLMDLQERWEKTEARKAFYAAMGAFQSEMPSLAKDTAVNFGQTHYRHASLGAISTAIRASLHAHDLSYRFEIENTEKGLSISCIVTHAAGHSERTTMGAPPDTSGSKNAIQSLGSTVTYMQRYTLVAALGLVTADEDTDGRPSMTGPAKPEPPAPKVPDDWPPPSPAPPPPKPSAPPKSAPAKSQAAPEGKEPECPWCDPDPHAAEGTEGCAVKAKDVPPGTAIIGAASVDVKGWLHLSHIDGVFRMSKANASAPDTPFPAWLQAGMILQVRTKKQLPSGVGFLAEILRVREPGPPPVVDGEIMDEEPAPFDSAGAAADGDGETPSSPAAASTSTPGVAREGNQFTLSGDAMPDAPAAAGAPAPSMSTLRTPAPAAPKAQLNDLRFRAKSAHGWASTKFGNDRADDALKACGITGPIMSCGSSEALEAFIDAVAALDTRDVPY